MRVSRVKKLLESYSRFISIPWREDAAAAQRVIFCVYNPSDELSLRTHIDEFEIATKQANHFWALYDLTNTFAQWLAAQRYAKSYFEKPQLLISLLPKYLDFIEDNFIEFIDQLDVNANHVLAIKGTGSLFGFVKVKDVVDRLAPHVKGRLVLFFPGEMPSQDNYRLLDAYDGWNYLAIAITPDKEF